MLLLAFQVDGVASCLMLCAALGLALIAYILDEDSRDLRITVWTLEDSTNPLHVERGILESSKLGSGARGILEPSNETPNSEHPDLFEDDNVSQDSTFQDTGGVESSNPDRFAGMDWREQQAARRREIRERHDEGAL